MEGVFIMLKYSYVRRNITWNVLVLLGLAAMFQFHILTITNK